MKALLKTITASFTKSEIELFLTRLLAEENPDFDVLSVEFNITTKTGQVEFDGADVRMAKKPVDVRAQILKSFSVSERHCAAL